MTRRVVLVALLALAGAGYAAVAEACSCLTEGQACEAYWKASAVFVGRVVSVSDLPVKRPGPPFLRSRRVSIEVLEGFSGVQGKTIEVQTGRGGGDCGYPFKEGASYLVYANGSPGDGLLTVSSCSRTVGIADAYADLAYSRAVASGAPLTGTISGTVSMVTRSLARGAPRPSRPLAGAGVLLERDGQRTRVETAPNGAFQATGLTAGRYSVRLDLASGLAGEVFPKVAELRDARACAEVRAEAFDDGRVAGRVVDAAGRPVPGLTIELTLPAGLDNPFGPERLHAVTDGAGHYEISQVPPGRFIVGINTLRSGNDRLLQPRYFHPGVDALAAATRVALTAGQRVTLRDFTIPAAVGFVSVSGVVFEAGGAPAANARVYLKGPAETDYVLGEPVVTGPDGRFTLAAIAGRSYRIFAERPREHTPGARVDSSDQVALTAGRDTPPVKLVLRRIY